ncbi:MAG: hypothetical protein K6G17_06780 [Oscillospiraceae bacterium]|nr:hypothetical protein [Oscillospiraceae bacterium]
MKKFLTWVCLAIFLFAGVFAAANLAAMPRTYDGSKAAASVYELRQNPEAGDDSNADGAAAAIVQQDLKNARAVNDVTSIVFDFRGYDTMGEAFILITAVAGTMVILFTKKTEKKEDEQA